MWAVKNVSFPVNCFKNEPVLRYLHAAIIVFIGSSWGGGGGGAQKLCGFEILARLAGCTIGVFKSWYIFLVEERGNADTAKEFILGMFLSVDHGHRIFPHFTQVTDTENSKLQVSS